MVIAISACGNSPNVLNGIKTARGEGATTVGSIGFDGGKLEEMVNISLIANNQCLEQVEDIHLILEHAVTTCLRDC